jgi:hypothetical protein
MAGLTPSYPNPGVVTEGINDPRHSIRHDELDQQDMFQSSTPGTDPGSRPLSKFCGIRLHNGCCHCILWKRHAVDETIRRGKRSGCQHEGVRLAWNIQDPGQGVN